MGVTGSRPEDSSDSLTHHNSSANSNDGEQETANTSAQPPNQPSPPSLDELFASLDPKIQLTLWKKALNDITFAEVSCPPKEVESFAFELDSKVSRCFTW